MSQSSLKLITLYLTITQKLVDLTERMLKMSKSIIKQQIVSSKTIFYVNYKIAKKQNGRHFLIIYAKMSRSWYVRLNTCINHSSKFDPIPSSRLDSIALTDIFTLYENHYAKDLWFKKLNLIWKCLNPSSNNKFCKAKHFWMSITKSQKIKMAAISSLIMRKCSKIDTFV